LCSAKLPYKLPLDSNRNAWLNFIFNDIPADIVEKPVHDPFKLKLKIRKTHAT